MIHVRLNFRFSPPYVSIYSDFDKFDKDTYSKQFPENVIVKEIVQTEFETHLSEIRKKFQVPTIIDPSILNEVYVHYSKSPVSVFKNLNYCISVDFFSRVIKLSLKCDNNDLCDFCAPLECSIEKMNKFIKEIGIIIGDTHNISYVSNNVNVDVTEVDFRTQFRDLFRPMPDRLTLILTLTKIDKIQTTETKTDINQITGTKPNINQTAEIKIDIDQTTETEISSDSSSPKKVRTKVPKNKSETKKTKVINKSSSNTTKPVAKAKPKASKKVISESTIEISTSAKQTKPKGSRKIPASLRTAVWKTYFGDDGKGRCYVGCGEDISVHNFECGHVIAHANGGTITLNNLRPICSKCNKSMRTTNLEEFITKYGFKARDNTET